MKNDCSAYKMMCNQREEERFKKLTEEQSNQYVRARMNTKMVKDFSDTVSLQYRPIETMDIMDNRFRHVLYIGSPHDIVDNDLVIGRAYLIDEINVGGSWSTIKLFRIDGEFNTVMFVEMPPNDPRAQAVTENMLVQWNSSLPNVRPVYPKDELC